MVLCRLLFVLVFSVASGLTFALGADGHRTVALIADAQLTTTARTELQRLLNREPGATLASISTWADEHKNPTTARWHYVNFPRGDCTYMAKRDCPDGNCLVGVIQRQVEILESNASDAKRLVALKYLIHLVGDVHQPLHSGYPDDKGGNKYQVRFSGRGTNLHALWDTGLIRNLNEEPEVLAARLLRSNLVVQAGEFNPVGAAQESCKIVAQPDFYPGRRVGTNYTNHFTPVAEQRLATAGARLAGLLNQMFR